VTTPTHRQSTFRSSRAMTGASSSTATAAATSRDVVSAMDLTMADLMPEKSEKPKAPRKLSLVERVETVYPYTDEQDRYLFEAVRLHSPKTFRQRVKDDLAEGGYRWTITGVRRVLYHLRLLLAAIMAGASILILEGEKDVHTAERIGFVATCNPMGAGNWEAAYSNSLRGASRVTDHCGQGS